MLDVRHIQAAREFAVWGGEGFTPDQGRVKLETGEAVLEKVRADLRCWALEKASVSDSTIVIAEVLDRYNAESGKRLIYLDRTFRRIVDPFAL